MWRPGPVLGLLAMLICVDGWADVRDGTEDQGRDYAYQYSPLANGAGYVSANWDAHPSGISYQLSVGTTPGGTDTFAPTDVGDVIAYTATDLTVELASSGVIYYVTVTPVTPAGPAAGWTSNGVQIAEAVTFTGTLGGVRNDPDGGFSVDFPPGSGINPLFGDHFFETVQVPAGVTVHVQPFGKHDAVSPSYDASTATPADGWLRLYANDITPSAVPLMPAGEAMVGEAAWGSNQLHPPSVALVGARAMAATTAMSAAAAMGQRAVAQSRTAQEWTAAGWAEPAEALQKIPLGPAVIPEALPAGLAHQTARERLEAVTDTGRAGAEEAAPTEQAAGAEAPEDFRGRLGTSIPPVATVAEPQPATAETPT